MAQNDWNFTRPSNVNGGLGVNLDFDAAFSQPVNPPTFQPDQHESRRNQTAYTTTETPSKIDPIMERLSSSNSQEENAKPVNTPHEPEVPAYQDGNVPYGALHRHVTDYSWKNFICEAEADAIVPKKIICKGIEYTASGIDPNVYPLGAVYSIKYKSPDDVAKHGCILVKIDGTKFIFTRPMLVPTSDENGNEGFSAESLETIVIHVDEIANGICVIDKMIDETNFRGTRYAFCYNKNVSDQYPHDTN